jgi:hypothetical protein
VNNKWGDEKAEIINPCPQHPENEVRYICKTERLCLCATCVFIHYKKQHEILSLEDTVNEVRSILISMEASMQIILREKKSMQ